MAKTSTRRWDLLGVGLSVACVIHCIALPFLATSIPALTASASDDQAFHIVMAVLAVLVGVTTFIPGWRRHRNLWIPVLGLLGIIALVSGSLIPCGGHAAQASACSAGHAHGAGGSCWTDHLHTAITPIGCVLLITAHIANRRCGCHSA